MDLKTKKIDSANASVEATIAKEDIDQKETALAREAAKDMQIAGFRKGKVPAHGGDRKRKLCSGNYNLYKTGNQH